MSYEVKAVSPEKTQAFLLGLHRLGSRNGLSTEQMMIELGNYLGYLCAIIPLDPKDRRELLALIQAKLAGAFERSLRHRVGRRKAGGQRLMDSRDRLIAELIAVGYGPARTAALLPIPARYVFMEQQPIPPEGSEAFAVYVRYLRSPAIKPKAIAMLEEKGLPIPEFLK